MFEHWNLHLNKSYSKMSQFQLVTSHRSVVPTAESNKLLHWSAVKIDWKTRIGLITLSLIGNYLGNFDTLIGNFMRKLADDCISNYCENITCCCNKESDKMAVKLMLVCILR